MWSWNRVEASRALPAHGVIVAAVTGGAVRKIEGVRGVGGYAPAGIILALRKSWCRSANVKLVLDSESGMGAVLLACQSTQALLTIIRDFDDKQRVMPWDRALLM